MKKINRLVFYILFAPFAIGAAVEFAPTWFGVPFIVVASILWIGSWLVIKRDAK